MILIPLIAVIVILISFGMAAFRKHGRRIKDMGLFDKLKRICLIGSMFLLAGSLVGCGLSRKGPLDIQKVTYSVGGGDTGFLKIYVMTSDEVVLYDFRKSGSDLDGYDYFTDGLPSEDEYTVSAQEVTEHEWTNLANVLTRVNFMEIPEDLPEPEGVYDGCTYYIQVETAEGIHKAGGYEAGYEKDSDSRRFRSALEPINLIIGDME